MGPFFFLLPPFPRPVSGQSLPFHPLSSPEFTPFCNQHCLSKNYPCTSVFFFSLLQNRVTNPYAHRHFVQQATSEKKRNGAARRPRGISTSSRFVYPYSHRISCLAASRPRACRCHMVPFAVILPVLPGRLFDRQSPLSAEPEHIRASHSPVENGIFSWSRSPWGVPLGSRVGSHAPHLFRTSTPNLLFNLFAPPDNGNAFVCLSAS